MKLILLEKVQSLGDEGNIVEVADGYARNYLLPRKKAVPVTASNMTVIERLKKRREQMMKDEVQQVRELAEKIEHISCTIPVQAGEDDRLYGSVTSADIAAALQQEDIEVDKRKIVLEEPIKKLGIYTVDIHIYPEVSAKLKVWVVKE